MSCAGYSFSDLIMTIDDISLPENPELTGEYYIHTLELSNILPDWDYLTECPTSCTLVT